MSELELLKRGSIIRLLDLAEEKEIPIVYKWPKEKLVKALEASLTSEEIKTWVEELNREKEIRKIIKRLLK